MELREYWRVFKRRAWIPILLLIVTALTAGVLVFLSKPEYTATATLEAKSQGTSTSGQTLSLPEVATSNSLALKVIQDLKLDETVDNLTRRIKVSSGRSNLYTITITDPNADRAATIANAVAKDAAILYQQLNGATGSTVYDDDVKAARTDFQKRYADASKALLIFNRDHPGAGHSSDIDLQSQLMQLQLQLDAAATAYKDFETQTTTASVNQLSQTNTFQATVVDQAAAKPDTTGRYLKVGYAAALALILGIGLIFLLEYIDNAVRIPEAVEEMIGAPVVGIIPRATAQAMRPAKGGAW